MYKDNRIISPVAKTVQPTAESKKRESIVFKNDLTEEDKNTVIARHVEDLRKLLSESTITVNTVARLLNVQHALASKLCKSSNSARSTLLNWSSTTSEVRRARSVLGKLSPEERDELLKQLR